jgi:enoyl-CoA hydratase/carnithine racemase
MEEQIIVGDAKGIRTISINRPEKKNALTVAMYDVMAKAISGEETAKGVRVLVIRGGDGIFTAGNDLMDFLQNPPSDKNSPVIQFLSAMAETTLPIVAAVSGPAIGVGSTILLHCDFVYADETAKFHFPFVNLALVPEASSSMLLPRLVGYQKAAELFMLGEAFSPQDAMELGLVSAVVAEGMLMDKAYETAGRLASKPTQALRATKALLRRPQEGLLDRIAAEGEAFRAQLTSPEAKEAMTAFLEKRPADFSKID